MSTPNKHCTVRLDRAKYERIVLLAAGGDCTPSGIGEYQHLALDIIIREQFPEYRDRLVAETDRRLEQFHGA